MAFSTVWGLDIGNSAIKAVKMIRTETECKIVDFDIIDLPEPTEEDKESISRVETAMRTLTTNHKFNNDAVFIAVPGNLCLHREFQLPPGSEQKLKELVLYEVKQQIPTPIEQLEWGWERYEDPQGVGVSMFAVRKTDIQDLMAMIQRLGLNVQGIVPAASALFNFTFYEFKPENTTLILDAGSKSTDFVVMNKRQIFTRTIPIAGREITRALENKFKVAFEKAEELKKNIGQSPQAKQILGVIDPTLRQLGSEIQKTVGFYKSKAKGQRLNQCYLLGHTFRLPGMAETLQGLVREAPFAIVEGLQRLKLDYSVNAEVWNNEFPTMAIAIGLGLQGLDASELKLNLLPESVQKQGALAAMKLWAAAAAALIVATVGFTYVHATSTAARYTDKLERVTKVEDDVQKYSKDELAATETLPQREALLKRLSRVGRDRGKVLQTFNTLANLSKDGKRMYGPDSEFKIMLTGLYVSRIPLGKTTGALATAGGGASAPATPDSGRTAINPADLSGKASIYAPLAKGQDPNTLPLELRPEPPMVVVVDGEYEKANQGTGALTKLTDALKASNFKDIRPNNYQDGVVKYAEVPLIYTYTGEPARQQGAAKAEVPYTTFHLPMRVDDQDDPDLEPTDAPPEKEKVK
jgi:type IV pilus assembly protein PilM